MQSHPTASTSTSATTPNDGVYLPTYSEAPLRRLPAHTYYSVEYPGYVRDTSVPQAVYNLGGLSALENVFRRTTKKEDALVDLKLRPDDPFAHPIPGDVAATQAIVLKVVKRKRIPKEGAPSGETLGEYTAEALGIVHKTLRFRSKPHCRCSRCKEEKNGLVIGVL
jgi:general transcription factor 3C polypeptide 5 (transcription factor C subunit 1)